MIIENPKFVNWVEFTNSNSLSLSDIVISFYDGLKIKIFPLKYLGKNYIIHTHVYQRDSKNHINKIKVTLTICPKAINPVVYQGHLNVVESNEEYLILTDGKVKFYQFNGLDMNSKKIELQRWEASIDVLYNIVVDENHAINNPVYLNINSGKSDLIDKIKNKLIYGIEYHSVSFEHPKAIHYVPKDESRINSKKNGFEKFYIDWNKKSNHRIALIHYTTLSSWMHFNTNSEFIQQE